MKKFKKTLLRICVFGLLASAVLGYMPAKSEEPVMIMPFSDRDPGA